MSSKRDHYRYKLNQGRKVVYYGTTNDPSRRENEHSSDGKKFTNMVVVGPVVKKDTALDWEQKRIEGYKKRNQGKNPKYND